MIMRFDDIHKFSDGTLQQIDDAMGNRVKEYKLSKPESAIYTMYWTQKDLKRNEEFIRAIRKLLKIRRIFCSLESYVGGRVREGDYRLLQRTI